MELFEQIRREYEFGVGTIEGVARKLGVHRRMVREALDERGPAGAERGERESPKLEPVREFIDRDSGGGPESAAQAAAHGAPDLGADASRSMPELQGCRKGRCGVTCGRESENWG